MYACCVDAIFVEIQMPHPIFQANEDQSILFSNLLPTIKIRFNHKIYTDYTNAKYTDLSFSYTVKNGIYIVKMGICNSISASLILHLHCASTVRHCIHSFKQQSQWLIPSSICYCMAEGNCAEHTCPATCLHHRARAGRDSVFIVE